MSIEALPEQPLFRDLDPEAYAKLTDVLSTGILSEDPPDLDLPKHELDAAERDRLIASVDKLRVKSRHIDCDPECKTFEFVAENERQARAYHFDEMDIVAVFINEAGEIFDFEWIPYLPED